MGQTSDVNQARTLEAEAEAEAKTHEAEAEAKLTRPRPRPSKFGDKWQPEKMRQKQRLINVKIINSKLAMLGYPITIK